MREKSADSNHVIIPYKVVNPRFNTLYGIVTGTLSMLRLRGIFGDIKWLIIGECRIDEYHIQRVMKPQELK